MICVRESGKQWKITQCNGNYKECVTKRDKERKTLHDMNSGLVSSLKAKLLRMDLKLPWE